MKLINNKINNEYMMKLIKIRINKWLMIMIEL